MQFSVVCVEQCFVGRQHRVHLMFLFALVCRHLLASLSPLIQEVKRGEKTDARAGRVDWRMFMTRKKYNHRSTNFSLLHTNTQACTHTSSHTHIHMHKHTFVSKQTFPGMLMVRCKVWGGEEKERERVETSVGSHP